MCSIVAKHHEPCGLLRRLPLPLGNGLCGSRSLLLIPQLQAGKTTESVLATSAYTYVSVRVTAKSRVYYERHDYSVYRTL